MGLDEALLTLIGMYGNAEEATVRITADEVTVTVVHDRGAMVDQLQARVAKERKERADMAERLRGAL